MTAVGFVCLNVAIVVVHLTKVVNFSHILLKKNKAMSPKHLCAGCLSALNSPLALACAFSIAPFVHDLLFLLTGTTCSAINKRLNEILLRKAAGT